MIKKSDGKIGLRGIISIFCMAVGFKLTDMTPTMIFKSTENSSWMVPIISGLIILIPLLLLLPVFKKYEDKGLIDIVYITMGKYFGFIFAFLLFITTLTGTVLNTRNLVGIVNTLFLPKSTNFLIYIQVIAISYFIANRGLETIGRICWFFFITIKGSLILVILFAWKEIDLSSLYPIWGTGKMSIIQESFFNISIFSEFILITILYQYFRSYKICKKSMFISIILTVFELTVFFIIYITIFGTRGVTLISFPFHQLTMYISAERFFTNLESLFFPFWIIGSTLRFSIYIYFTSAALGFTLKLKEFEPLILPVSALTLLLGLIPKNIVKTVLVYRENYFYKYSFVYILGLPVILFILSKIRGEVNR